MCVCLTRPKKGVFGFDQRSSRVACCGKGVFFFQNRRGSFSKNVKYLRGKFDRDLRVRKLPWNLYPWMLIARVDRIPSVCSIAVTFLFLHR